MKDIGQVVRFRRTFRSTGMLAVAVMALVVMIGASHADPVLISEDNVAFFYEAHAPEPTPDHKLARMFSSDYASARDEFTRHDLLEQIRPAIKLRTDEARSTTEVVLNVVGRLGDYQFDSQSFPTGFTEGSFVPFGNAYAVTFSNGQQLNAIPLDVERARSLSEELRQSRRMVMTIYGNVVDSQEVSLHRSRKKAVRVTVTRLTVKLKTGTLVGDKSI